jgi:hypothetical protein
VDGGVTLGAESHEVLVVVPAAVSYLPAVMDAERVILSASVPQRWQR